MGAEASSCFACFEGDHGPYADSHRYTCFEDLQLDKELGHGAFSTVRLGINRKNKDKFAVKVVHKSKLSKQDIDALHVEVGILSKLRHPHVVKYFDFTQDRSHYYIVLEVVAGGELFDRIVQRVYYSEKEARDLVWVLLDVLHHLHGKKIAHRDLKPENLLLKSTHNDHDIKLADFGFATECKKPLRDLCGTPAYVAPEIIREKPYGLEVDMWSCGVIVFILLGGYPPFDDANGVSDMYAQIKRGAFTFDERYWSSVSSEAQLFIKSLLQVDPSKRPSAAAAMNHDWFTKHATELSTTDLSKTIDNMKKWNARRKLKGGIKAVMASNRVAAAARGGQ
jgi:serine/threonine protein kinase|mmetsp:Transcript_15616/g.41091  ORF Transcript_15616/g.41091 Transcript_15616/m.41091 type:complete len:337 (-) Transcript_15616:34-1044(-)